MTTIKVIVLLVVLCSVFFVIQCKKDKIIIGGFGGKKHRQTQISKS